MGSALMLIGIGCTIIVWSVLLMYLNNKKLNK